MYNLFPFFRYFPSTVYLDSAVTTLKPVSVISALREGYAKYTLGIERTPLVNDDFFDETVFITKNKIQELFGAQKYHIFFSFSATIILYKILIILRKIALAKNKKMSVCCPYLTHNAFLEPLLDYCDVFDVHQSKKNHFYLDLSNMSFDVIYLPLVNHITGEKYDSSFLKEYKKRNPHTLIIGDACQFTRTDTVNLGKDTIFDFFLFSGHKMYGPEGIAVLCLEDNFIVHNIFFYELYDLISLKREISSGSISYPALFAFYHSLLFIEKYVYSDDLVGTLLEKKVRYLFDEFSASTDINIISKKHSHDIFTFILYNKNKKEKLMKYSRENNIIFRTGEICTKSEEFSDNDFVRISFAIYNSKEDVEKISAVLKEALLD
jgi:cysteine sulfinate desulfinase